MSDFKNNPFVLAMQKNDIFTENGMPTNSSSGDGVLDMFYRMGAARDLPEKEVRAMFQRAIGENSELALKAAFYCRDVRGGQGERKTGRRFFRHLASEYPKTFVWNLDNITYFGRADDVLISAWGIDSVMPHVARYYQLELQNGNGLVAKWLPRPNKAGGHMAKWLAKQWGIDKGQYRRMLSGLTDVVETQMCNREWEEINYQRVPSQAMRIYSRAFERHDPERFEKYVAAVERGETKISAGAVFPHEILRPAWRDTEWVFIRGDQLTMAERRRIEAQWQAQPDWVPKGKYLLPVCDTSGSMRGQPLEVAVSLSLYLAERNVGPFKDMFITFSRQPELQLLRGKTIIERMDELSSAAWMGNTDLEATLLLILGQASKNKLSTTHMPQTLLILSDMQFDACVSNYNDSTLQMIDRLYKSYGYSRPRIVFWNLRTSRGIPVRHDENGISLVSGFSPSAMGFVLSGADPHETMVNKLMSDRYDRIRVV